MCEGGASYDYSGEKSTYGHAQNEGLPYTLRQCSQQQRTNTPRVSMLLGLPRLDIVLHLFSTMAVDSPSWRRGCSLKYCKTSRLTQLLMPDDDSIILLINDPSFVDEWSSNVVVASFSL